jgi:hypothetical protein
MNPFNIERLPVYKAVFREGICKRSSDSNAHIVMLSLSRYMRRRNGRGYKTSWLLCSWRKKRGRG